jgi:hypothetical protein
MELRIWVLELGDVFLTGTLADPRICGILTDFFPHLHTERKELPGWHEIPENMEFSKVFKRIQELPSHWMANCNY